MRPIAVEYCGLFRTDLGPETPVSRARCTGSSKMDSATSLMPAHQAASPGEDDAAAEHAQRDLRLDLLS